MNETTIYILHTKKSKKSDDTYCIAVMNLGTPYTEFIVGETDNAREYKLGDAIEYVWHAEYYNNLETALDVFNELN